MGIKVVKQTEVKSKNQSTQRRCRHNNGGYCKMETEFVYYHTDKICDKFLANGKCEQERWCLNRHPKDCKFWLGDPQGCLRGQICKYLHKIENKGKNVKVLESNSDVSDKASEKVKVFSIKATHDDKKDTVK